MEVELIHDIWVVAQVVLLDLALGGDNSIVIGMACKSLPHDMQKKAIIYGTAGAIILRFIMAAAVVWLLQIPYLHTVGGVLLVFIGMKLIGKQETEEAVHVDAKKSMAGAVRTIIAADALMSLDNVLGIVGATGGHMGLLVFGMIISVPIIIFGSAVVIKVMHKFPVLIYLGGLILGWAAGSMVAADEYLGLARETGLYVKIALTAVTALGGFAWNHIAAKPDTKGV